ncbi:MAG: hypothetical protein E6I47_11375 [Chloroflexi bacterium]|nr:MAG: hypothetical protein E6I47_11375 [Chloroflexota bacterium]
MLDDRLDGKDLEWARDHLRRCEACRERVEDFREMLLRVGRLPSATVGSTAMDQAFALSIPDRLRTQGDMRSFEVAPALPAAMVPAPHDLPPAARPEVSSIPDLLTELEREIFRDEPLQDHPMPLSPVPEPLYPAMTDIPEEMGPVEDAEPAQAAESEPAEPAPAEILSGPLREVPVDSHREVEFTDWDREPEPEPAPAPALEASPVPIPVPATSNAIFDQEPALRIDDESEGVVAAPPRKPDTAMRIAVGLGAAACVLLAAVLYEGGLLKTTQKVGSTAATATQSIHPSATARASVSPSASPAATLSASTAPVLYTLGNGVTGGTMFRIRPGTAVAGYTRLVFDMNGNGLPTMIITRPDDLHVAVTFKDTNVTGAPVNGISSYHVTAVEPGVQQGADGNITIDLARPVRVTAFTLPATGSYAWRLVIDLHTS